MDGYDNILSDEREVFLNEMEKKFDLKLTIVELEFQKNFVEKYAYDFSVITLIKILKNDVPNIKHIDLKTNGVVNIFTILPNNSYLKFEIERERFTASNPHQLLVLMVVANGSIVKILVEHLLLENTLLTVY